MQVAFVCLQLFRRNSLLKYVWQPEVAKNSLNPLILWVQGHSRSSISSFLKSTSPVLVMISSMSVPICNHLHARQTTEIQSVTCHLRSHSVSCHPTQINLPCLNPSQTSIPRRDGRLSWLWWLAIYRHGLFVIIA